MHDTTFYCVKKMKVKLIVHILNLKKIELLVVHRNTDTQEAHSHSIDRWPCVGMMPPGLQLENIQVFVAVFRLFGDLDEGPS